MANGAYIGVDSKARKIKDIYIGVDGKARKVTKAYIGVNGKAQLFWAVGGGDTVILEVEKITSDTYAGETQYTGEQFILLDIYPKTNGTVNVTYGGLTKTITDTSGAAEPNAQQVFFGTFNGVSDSVATPASGELTIDGDCRGFACASFTDKEKSILLPHWNRITAVKSLGNIEIIADECFYNCPLTSIKIPDSVTSIGKMSFAYCTAANVEIGNNVTSIGQQAFSVMYQLESIVLPASIETLADHACATGTLKTVTMLGTTPPELLYDEMSDGVIQYCQFGSLTAETVYLEKIIVPAGCSNAYKSNESWIASGYTDYIVEAS